MCLWEQTLLATSCAMREIAATRMRCARAERRQDITLVYVNRDITGPVCATFALVSMHLFSFQEHALKAKQILEKHCFLIMVLVALFYFLHKIYT